MKESKGTGKLAGMTAKLAAVVVTFGLVATSHAQTSSVQNAPAKKKWTILVFMNGHNNLDEFTKKDLNEMEAVGSNDDINIVAQWASQERDNTERLLVQKDADTANVTSHIVESLPRVDMGNYQELVKFLEWAIERYPAEHYLVDVWNHGNGWVARNAAPDFSVDNISYDDISGNSISIPELGLALKAASEKAGQKIDIYGSDACLMAMVEVASELSPYVKYMTGSEEVEPMDGWDYTHILTNLAAKPASTPLELGKQIVDSYMESYSTGYSGALYSLVDLEKMDDLSLSMIDLVALLNEKGASNRRLILQAARSAETYEAHTDYVDLMGFLANLERSTLNVAADARFAQVKTAFGQAVVYNKTYKKRGMGLSIWIPPSSYTFNSNANAYKSLRFHKDTAWGDFLQALHSAQTPQVQGSTGTGTGSVTSLF